MTVCGIEKPDGVCVMGKCPYIKLCCNVCNGKGYVYNALGNFKEDCAVCGGTGFVVREKQSGKEKHKE